MLLYKTLTPLSLVRLVNMVPRGLRAPLIRRHTGKTTTNKSPIVNGVLIKARPETLQASQRSGIEGFKVSLHAEPHCAPPLC